MRKLIFLPILLFIACANFHAQDVADMVYKYRTKYIFQNPQLDLQEKKATWLGVAIAQREAELSGKDIAEIWKVYYHGWKIQSKEAQNDPVALWQMLKKNNKLDWYFKLKQYPPQTQTVESWGE